MVKMVNVQWKHIKAGKRHSVTMNPIALAIKDQLGIAPNVSNSLVSLDRKKEWYVTGGHIIVDHFISRFNSGVNVRPFSFKVENMKHCTNCGTTQSVDKTCAVARCVESQNANPLCWACWQIIAVCWSCELEGASTGTVGYE